MTDREQELAGQRGQTRIGADRGVQIADQPAEVSAGERRGGNVPYRIVGCRRQESSGAQAGRQGLRLLFLDGSELEIRPGGQLQATVTELLGELAQRAQLSAGQQAPGQPDTRQQPVGGGMEPQRAGTGVGVRLTKACHGPDTTGGLRQDRSLGSAQDNFVSGITGLVSGVTEVALTSRPGRVRASSSVWRNK